MKLIGITTALNYSDYLSVAIGTFTSAFDVLYVVTQFADPACEVASRCGAIVCVYDGWHKDGATFNKAGAIRRAQEHAYRTHPDDWYVLVDADILLPHDARETLIQHATDANALYSARRVDYHTPESLRSLSHDKVYGSAFAGFLQCYKRHCLYPESSHSAEACDLVFASQFSSCRMLPMTVGHLGREAVNWKGRVSPLWQQ